MPLRVVFMGTPDFSVPFLTEIIGQGHEVVAVYSQPPRPAGRGMEERKAPVHEKAEQFGIPVLTPVSLKGEAEQSAFLAHDADVAIVVAYGLILPKPILDAPRHGCFNGHASLLPRWRGAAPIQRAIMAGDSETGIMVMKMDEGLDTGDVAMAERVAISDEMTASDLHDQLSALGANLMVRALGAIERDQLNLTPQPNEGVTYAEKISKSEARIDWQEASKTVHRHIMGLSPFPGSWCEMVLGDKPVRVKVLRSRLVEGQGKPGEVLDDQLTIACGEGAVRITQLQRSGKQAQDAQEFLRGNRLEPGTVIG